MITVKAAAERRSPEEIIEQVEGWAQGISVKKVLLTEAISMISSQIQSEKGVAGQEAVIRAQNLVDQ